MISAPSMRVTRSLLLVSEARSEPARSTSVHVPRSSPPPPRTRIVIIAWEREESAFTCARRGRRVTTRNPEGRGGRDGAPAWMR